MLLVGVGGGLFSHGTLTATMNSAPKEQVGLALGTWGAVQATAAGIAVAAGGIMSDVISGLATRGALGPQLATPTTPYVLVYGIEVLLLAGTVALMYTLVGSSLRRPPQ